MRRNYNAPARRWKRGMQAYHKKPNRVPRFASGWLYINGHRVGAIQSMKWSIDTFQPIRAEAMVGDRDSERDMLIEPRECHGTGKNLRIRGDIVADTMRRAKLLMIDDPGREAA